MRLTRTLLALVMLAFTAGAAAAQTADDIVDKSITALGGRAAIAKITSRSTTGSMAVSTPGGDVAGSIEILNEAPNKVRRVIVLDLSAFGAPPATIEQRFDGTSAYVSDSTRGESALTASQLDNLKNGIFPTPLLDYKTRGTKIALAGKEKVADRDAFVLTMTPAAGPVTRLFVDAESYLPVRTVVTLDVPEAGTQQQTADLSDYREIDGLKVPFVIKGSSPMQTFTITVKKVEHNVKIDPAMFVKPAAR